MGWAGLGCVSWLPLIVFLNDLEAWARFVGGWDDRLFLVRRGVAAGRASRSTWRSVAVYEGAVLERDLLCAADCGGRG